MANLERVGTGLATVDSDTLAELSAEGLAIGTKVWNEDVGAYFALTVSTAALDPDVVVEVKDTVGARWIIDTTGVGAISSLTGGVTATGPGAAPATVHDLPLDATAIPAPATPAAGKGACYVDSTSKNLCVKDDAGVVKHGAQTASPASSMLTGLTDAGVFGSAPTMVLSSQALTDANLTTALGTSAKGLYYLPTGTLTQNRTVKFQNSGSAVTCVAHVAVVGIQGFDLIVTDEADTEIFRVTAGAKRACRVYFGSSAINNGEFGLA